MNKDYLDIERRWQEYWESNSTFRITDDSPKRKIYILDMFPYPSGAGLHVGHPEGYTASDILARYYRMKGFNVMHPMGWDAFGLPAEQQAMRTNIHPRVTTERSVSNFRRQIKMLGLSYDWSREINTTDPKYFRWTQWIFLKMYHSWFDQRLQKARPIDTLIEELGKTGTSNITGGKQCTAKEWKSKSDLEKQAFLADYRLAYIAEIPVNWCERLGTVLANEEVAEWIEKGYTVERKPLRQWMMRITAYAERLLNDLDILDWPPSTMEQQRNWIGRSEGAEIDFRIAGAGETIRVYTTRPDTIFGATYMVLAPEHPLVEKLTSPAQRRVMEEYRKLTSLKSDLERGTEKEKTGVPIGCNAINPATGKEIPIWIADYVMMGYGTGAIMAVPAHDQRDFEFAKKYGLSILQVVTGPEKEGEAFEGEGTGINSSNSEVSLNGLTTPEAKREILAWFERRGLGKQAVKYKLRDWLFSRQRYWGEPIPIIHWEDGLITSVPESELPLELPNLEKFQPSGSTESPLVLATDWVNVLDPKNGKRGKRETNTMPQWAGSCWYYVRYLDPDNQDTLCAPEKQKYWLPIDIYIGGAEHAVLHLIYARFWHKVLYDLGYLNTHEPFMKLRHQGMILGEDGSKMSKSRGNVINPDEVVEQYGADSFRMFEMFMGPLEEMKPWSTRGVEGVFRFRNRVWRLFVGEDDALSPRLTDVSPSPGFERLYHQTVKKVTQDIEAMRFNTALSQLMIFINEAYKQSQLNKSILEGFVLMFSPFAPHICEELWARLGHAKTLAYEPWPSYEEAKTAEPMIDVVVQVNGKLRSKVTVAPGTDQEMVVAQALQDPNVQRHVEGKRRVKTIFVQNKLLNIVVAEQ